MNNSLLSSLLKKVMRGCKLKQQDLADVLGVRLDRVKSLTSGKVNKLTREESERLIAKLHIRADWLITGEGPMFLSEREQHLATLERGAGARAGVNSVSQETLDHMAGRTSATFFDAQKEQAQTERLQHLATLERVVGRRAGVNSVSQETLDKMQGRVSAAEPVQADPDERELLDAYRRAPVRNKVLLLEIALVMAK